MSAPERIYLQDAGDYSKAAALEVTWCVEPQDDGDTGYIRADAVAEMIQQAVTAEREGCAALLDAKYQAAMAKSDADLTDDVLSHRAAVYGICAAAIRARGEGVE